MSRPSGPTPDLYISTGYEQGSLFIHPNFPSSFGIDNHDSITDLQWSAISPKQAAASGTLKQDSCTPNCAEGTTIQYPIRIVASEPQTCTVTVYSNYSGPGGGQQQSAYVFNRIAIEALSGSPDPHLIGANVVSHPCG